MVPLFEELREAIGKRKKCIPSLKRILRGWVCYRVVSEQATTLGLLGLMKESSEFFFLETFKR